MISAPIIQITAPPRRLIRLLVILSVASMALPLSNQTAMASPWAVEKFETYQQHPDWVNTRCQNMEKVNQKGLSNFTEKVASLEKNTIQTFRRKVPRRLLSFIDSLVRGFVRLLGSSLNIIGNGVDMLKESN
jgi:hypothetical protein